MKKAAKQQVHQAPGLDWSAEFVTKIEPEETWGKNEAANQWKTACFPLDVVKDTDGVDGSKTKAEAVAYWLNQGYSWDVCLPYWDTLQAVNGSREIDGPSRKRLKENLNGMLQ